MIRSERTLNTDQRYIFDRYEKIKKKQLDRQSNLSDSQIHVVMEKEWNVITPINMVGVLKAD